MARLKDILEKREENEILNEEESIMSPREIKKYTGYLNDIKKLIPQALLKNVKTKEGQMAFEEDIKEIIHISNLMTNILKGK